MTTPTGKGSPTDVPSASHRRDEPDRAEVTGRRDRTDRDGPPRPRSPYPSAASSVSTAPHQPMITVTPADLPGRQREVLSSHRDGTEPGTRREPAQWSHFAPREARPHSRPVAAGIAGVRAVGRGIGHEWTVVSVAALALACAVNWTVFRHPTRSLPHDAAESSFGAYMIAWLGHALLDAPGRLWRPAAFHPSPAGIAFPDPLLGFAPAALIGTGPEAAALRYNLIFLLVVALAFVGPYALARQLGTGRLGACVAGAAVALAPWRLAQAGQLAVLSIGGVALALAMLARGHGLRLRTPPRGEEQPDRTPRAGWALAGWLVAAWQLSLGLTIGAVFLWLLVLLALAGAAAAVWRWARRSPRAPTRLLIFDALGVLVFAAVAAVLAAPYRDAVQRWLPADAVRDVADHSPSWRGLLTAPADSLVWGGLHAGARTSPGSAGLALLPGYMLAALALGGLVFSIWTVRARLVLLAAAAVSVLLVLGAHGVAKGRFGYAWLVEHGPGFEGLREPGRLIGWTSLLLALLAAGGVEALVRRAQRGAQLRGDPQPANWAWAALAVPLLLIVVEGLGTPAQPRIATPPAALASAATPYLVLPTGDRTDADALLWSTDGFPSVVNGAGRTTAELARTRTEVASFPSAESIAYLRDQGVLTVILLPDRVAGTPWADAIDRPVDGLGITREETPRAILFRL